ncbi:MAG TPA: S9 family peptidase, partial [Thermomicrobiales bacterium]|nr:S9 family peptidase [Thermomicrobiales bacterium]
MPERISTAHAGLEPPGVRPPAADARPAVRAVSGVEIADPYAWLENPADPETIAYLKAENAYRDAVMAPTAALQDTLYAEMLGRIQQTDRSVPVKIGPWRYAVRTEEGRQYPILVREPAEGGPEATLLDLNAMLRAGYISLIDWAPSPDHRYLAYLLNETGGLERTLYVKDLVTGETLPEAIPDVGGDVVWANDSRTLFYLKQDAARRSFQLARHRLGDDPAADAVGYTEADEVFSLDLSATNDRSFLLLSSGSKESNEIRFLAANEPDGEWRVFDGRRNGILYHLEHRDDEFLILTNEHAPNFKLQRAPVAAPQPANRRDLVPHDPDRMLAVFDVFERGIVLYGREDGLSQVYLLPAGSETPRRVAFDEAVYVVRGEWTPEFESPAVRIRYSSFVTPNAIFDLDLETGDRTLLKQDVVPSGHDPARYVTERLWATAADGERIPISLIRLRDQPPGPQPLLLYGYGSYGLNTEPSFGANILSLVDRGVAFAQAHIRGGQERGRWWYEAGKMLRKQNTFSDFIAAADYLVETGRTSRDQLALLGGSAGGLLIGAVVNARPDLAQAAIAAVPFVDVIRVMLDPSLPLTTGEFVEWGNPLDPEYRAYIGSYSPYDNTAARPY